MDDGMVHVYYGNGKGKTSAAFGLAMRASGRGKRVLIAQFLKSNDSGERIAAKLINNMTLLPCPDRVTFTDEMTEQEKSDMHIYYDSLFNRAVDMAVRDKYDVIILDEVLTAIYAGLLEKSKLVDLLKERDEQLEVVMTGCCADDDIIEYADYASKIEAVKHPYNSGTPARIGIEL